LKSTAPDHYQAIEDTVRQIAPFFARFDLQPAKLKASTIRLEWREVGAPDVLFGPEALSDGTLRFMCLATLFLQPEPPDVILIDEPELGLHPAAIVLLAALLQSAAVKSQVLVATQSAPLVSQLEPQDVWIVDRTDGASTFKNLAESDDVDAWLENYSLGDLWEKNIIGGRP
jgi:predicted ATPase